MHLNNNQLLEESGDIEHQVQLFSANLLGGKIDDEKYKLQNDYSRKLQEVKDQLQQDIQKAKERAHKDTKQKLERDRERELAKGSLHNNELEDAKDEVKRQQQTTIRNKKRDAENKLRDQQREFREQFDQKLDQRQTEIKQQIAREFKLEDESVNTQIEHFKDEYKHRLRQLENEKSDLFDKEKIQLEKKMQLEWQKERKAFEDDEKETAQGR